MALSIVSSIEVLYLASINSGLKNISGPKNASYPTSTTYSSLVIECFPLYCLNLDLPLYEAISKIFISSTNPS